MDEWTNGRMEDSEPAVGNSGGFGRVGRKLPLKRTVRLPPTTNVLLQIGAGADDFRIGIFQSPLTIGIVERSPLGKDIADGRIDRAGEEAMGFMETGDDFWCHPSNKGKGPGGVRALQLNPGPGCEAEILVFRQTVPNLHAGQAEDVRRKRIAPPSVTPLFATIAPPLTPYPLRVNSSLLIASSYNA